MSEALQTVATMEEFLQLAAEPPEDDAQNDIVLRYVLKNTGAKLVFIQQTKHRKVTEECYWEDIRLYTLEVVLGEFHRQAVEADNAFLRRKAARAIELGLPVSVPQATYSIPMISIPTLEFKQIVTEAFSKGEWRLEGDSPKTERKMEHVKIGPWIDKRAQFFLPVLPAGVVIDHYHNSDWTKITAVEFLGSGAPDTISMGIGLTKNSFPHQLFNSHGYHPLKIPIEGTEEGLLKFRDGVPTLLKSYGDWFQAKNAQSQESALEREKRELATLFNVEIPKT